MIFTSPTCGRYTAGRACDQCAPQAPPPPDPTPHRPISPTPAPGRLPNHWSRALGQVPASGFRLHGVVTDGNPVHTEAAFPVSAVKVTVLVMMVGLLIAYRDLVSLMILKLTLSFLPVLLLAVVGFVVMARLGSGCLEHLLGGALVGGLSRPRNEPDGWDLMIETDEGLVRARVAAVIPLSEGDEVEISGPNLRGVKQAWVLRRVAPATAVRLGRGIFGIGVALTAGLVLFTLMLIA